MPIVPLTGQVPELGAGLEPEELDPDEPEPDELEPDELAPALVEPELPLEPCVFVEAGAVLELPEELPASGLR